MSLSDITVTCCSFWTHRRFDLIDQQLVQSSDKAVSVSKSRITGGFPHKGIVMWRTRVRASSNIICMICNRLIACAVSHPDNIAIGNISSGWLMVNVLCHPDEIINLIPKSSGWLSYSQYLIRMTYDQCRMSSGWLTMFPYVIRMR